MSDDNKFNYCVNLFRRERLKTPEVFVGKLGFGGVNPVRIQSMTTTDTLNTESSIEQSIRMIEAGCELVRLTAPSKKEAENLREIKAGLRNRGYSTPLVADIHFTPNAAEIAAELVEKVRVNPGNYADKKKFEEIEYTDEAYNAELGRIEEKFTPLVNICKKNGTAMRIGTNHGSLSDRILSRFGDTPKGMVESAMEFVRICVKNNYHELVLSMKASNTLVMVQAYRLLVHTLALEGLSFPLHLGVTEAGDGEDGRIKSAVGIGALLEDGIGDTVRVSLTEEPEAEIPVAQLLLEKFEDNNENTFAFYKNEPIQLPYDPYSYSRRTSKQILNIGDHCVPVVVADLSGVRNIKPANLFGFGYSYSVPNDKWSLSDSAADIIYLGDQQVDFALPGSVNVLLSFDNWSNNYRTNPNYYPCFDKESLTKKGSLDVCFITHRAEDFNVSYLANFPNAVVIVDTPFTNKTQLYRNLFLNFAENGLNNPTILCSSPKTDNREQFQLWASSELGALLLDGFGDGVWLKGSVGSQLLNATSFGILQATRTRISKTEYISCPSCGRTLFDLQETTAKIREKTAHLKGLKIGIMGCIVNGPGEMADADYGYVGTGKGKITLYKEKEIMKKNISEENAVDALIELIQENGDWKDKKD